MTKQAIPVRKRTSSKFKGKSWSQSVTTEKNLVKKNRSNISKIPPPSHKKKCLGSDGDCSYISTMQLKTGVILTHITINHVFFKELSKSKKQP